MSSCTDPRRPVIQPSAREPTLGADVLVGLPLGLALLLVACAPAPQVPTHVVEEVPFERRISAEGNLKSRTVTRVAVPSEVRRAARIVWMAAEGAEVEEGDVVARFDRVEMEQRLETGRSDLETSDLQSTRARLDGDSSERDLRTRSEVAGLESELADRFLRDDDEIFSRAEIRESEIEASVARSRQQQTAGLADVRSEASDHEMELLGIRRRRAVYDVDQARSALSALEIRAPHGGILSWLQGRGGEIPQIGDEVWSGQQLLEIPDLRSMDAEIFVVEADAGGLREGLSATIRLDAHPGAAYQATVGKVDAVSRRPFRGSPTQYFGVRLLVQDLPAEQAKPGQRLVATVELERRERALVVPRQVLFSKESRTWVWRASGDSFEAVEVVLGPVSPGLVVVESGLSIGDVVALERPAGVPADSEVVALLGGSVVADAALGEPHSQESEEE